MSTTTETLAVGARVRCVPSRYDSAPDYVGLTGTVVTVGESWSDEGERITQYRVEIDRTDENDIILLLLPAWAWDPEGPRIFWLMSHELEEVGE